MKAGVLKGINELGIVGDFVAEGEELEGLRIFYPWSSVLAMTQPDDQRPLRALRAVSDGQGEAG